MTKQQTLWVALCTSLMVALLVLGRNEFSQFMVEHFERFSNLGTVAYLIYSVVFFVAALLPLPLLPLSALGGFLMGFVWGACLLYPAAILSACASHLIGRRYFVRRVPEILSRFPRASFLIQEAVRTNWKVVALNRLLPVCPFAIQNVLLGAIGLPVRAQFLGTMVGIVPALGLAIYAGSVAHELSVVLRQPEMIFPEARVALLGLSGITVLIIGWWLKMKLKRHIEEQAQSVETD